MASWRWEGEGKDKSRSGSTQVDNDGGETLDERKVKNAVLVVVGSGQASKMTGGEGAPRLPPRRKALQE